MSLKRQLKYKYQNFQFSVRTMALPAWLTSPLVRLGLLFLILFFGLAYILNITSSANSGYQVRELEKNTQGLQMQVAKLEVEIAENSSINNIASRLGNLNMVAASGMKHLTVKNSAVAKN
jgi:hypothetical protein